MPYDLNKFEFRATKSTATIHNCISALCLEVHIVTGAEIRFLVVTAEGILDLKEPHLDISLQIKLVKVTERLYALVVGHPNVRST